MLDSQAEDRLRNVLRAEGDSLSSTITTAELERRLEARRRAATGRRVSVIAAAVAIVAVGTMVAASNGWITLPAVGVVGPSPSPAPTPLSSPAALPVASPSGGPTTRQPLGTPDQAILVRLVGDPAHPDAFEVTRVDSATGRSTVIASIPWTVLPSNVSVPDVGPPSISATGWLAIPFNGAGNVDGQLPLLALVDVTHPETEPWIVDGSGGNSWNGSEQLGVTDSRGIFLDDPLTRQQSYIPLLDRSLSLQEGRHGGIIWSSEPGTLALARRGAAAEPEWGSIGTDGAFSASADLPPAFQRLGLERPTGAAGHVVAQDCSLLGSASPAACPLVERDSSGTVVATRLDDQDSVSLADRVWAADGTGLWLLMGLPGETTATLEYARADDGRNDIARIAIPTPGSWSTILGITSETKAGNAVVAIGSEMDRVWAFVGPGGSVTTLDGTAWFAGWAGDQPAYDPD